MAHAKTMESAKMMEDADKTETNPFIEVKEYAAQKTTGIGAEAVVVEPIVILHITVGHTECVPIRAKTAGPQKKDTKRTRCVVTIC